MRITIDEAVLDARCQARSVLDPDAVAVYTDRYIAAEPMPPIEVFDVDGVLYVVDGFHRLAASVQAELSWVTVFVGGKGTMDEAIWHATSANLEHGVRRTRADKRRAVELAVDSAIGQEQSSRSIAIHCGVSHTLVSQVRSAWEVDSNPPEPTENHPPQGGKIATPPPVVTESYSTDGGKIATPPPKHPGGPGRMPSYGGNLEELRQQMLRLRLVCVAQLTAPSLRLTLERVRAKLTEVAAELRYVQPVACDRCGGGALRMGCDVCDGAGWVRIGDTLSRLPGSGE